MKVHIYGMLLLLGVVLAVHLSMNAKAGSVINNPRVGNALFWCIGAVMALAIGLSVWEPGALASLQDVNHLLLTAGGLGACLVFALAWVIPQAGAGPVMLTLLTGQVIGGMIMSHFGWLGSPTEPITLTKIAGVIVMMSGAAIVSFMK